MVVLYHAMQKLMGRLILGTYRYKSIESILKHGLDSKTIEIAEESVLPQQHENVRGSGYYH
jgi:stress-induced morphogen